MKTQFERLDSEKFASLVPGAMWQVKGGGGEVGTTDGDTRFVMEEYRSVEIDGKMVAQCRKVYYSYTSDFKNGDGNTYFKGGKDWATAWE